MEKLSTPIDSIYRFDSFKHFKDIIQKNALYFVHHSKWNDDKEEGLIFKKLKTRQGRFEIEQILRELRPDDPLLMGILINFDLCIRGHSWTKVESNTYFWQKHSMNNDSIRLEISRNDIKYLDREGTGPVTAYDIDYKNTSVRDDIKEFLDVAPNQIDIVKIMLRKRPEYAHEKEVRLILVSLDYLPDDNSDMQLAMVSDLYKKNRIDGNEYKARVARIIRGRELHTYVKFDHIENFIKSVMVHPKASDSFIQEVRDICLSNDIKFSGKSNCTMN